jgi:hypothetical protein
MPQPLNTRPFSTVDGTGFATWIAPVYSSKELALVPKPQVTHPRSIGETAWLCLYAKHGLAHISHILSRYVVSQASPSTCR